MQPPRSSQNLFGQVQAHIINSSKPEDYDRAPPLTILTSGGSVGTQKLFELKIVIWTSLRNRLSSPAIDFLSVFYCTQECFEHLGRWIGVIPAYPITMITQFRADITQSTIRDDDFTVKTGFPELWMSFDTLYCDKDTLQSLGPFRRWLVIVVIEFSIPVDYPESKKSYTLQSRPNHSE